MPDVGVSHLGAPDDPRLNIFSKVTKKIHVLLYLDITDIVKQKKWRFENVLAKITGSTYKFNVPQPLVIVRNQDEETVTVTLGPEQKREDYGDILDEFTVV